MARPDWMLNREIVDATEGITINIRKRDIIGAVALNGVDCVAGRCTLRALDAQWTYFYRSVAYIGYDEESPLIRYKLSAKLIRKVIVILDDPDRDNSEIEPGFYQLLPVPPGQRLGIDRTRKPGAARRAPRKDRGHRVIGRVTAARKLGASTE